ncbi:unnamed protein product [Owenia fusiformis]|uniref:Uncharacterized protein n=1 Tax=Owenia fusiformis TaxID=6347 RepID=A0A8S4Q4K3_OWEFU|nr:unnamed protein product [Owenia fusiformis]
MSTEASTSNSSSTILQSWVLDANLQFNVCSYSLGGIYGDFTRNGFSYKLQKNFATHYFMSRNLYRKLKSAVDTIDGWMETKTYSKTIVLAKNNLLSINPDFVHLIFLDKNRKVDEFKLLEIGFDEWKKLIGYIPEIDQHLSMKRSSENDDGKIKCFRLCTTNEDGTIEYGEWTTAFDKAIASIDLKLAMGSDGSSMMIEDHSFIPLQEEEMVKYAYWFLLACEKSRKPTCRYCVAGINPPNLLEHDCMDDGSYINVGAVINIEIERVAFRLAAFFNMTIVGDKYHQLIENVTSKNWDDDDITPSTPTEEMIRNILKTIW